MVEVVEILKPSNLSDNMSGNCKEECENENFHGGDIAWSVACSVIVWLMVPGIGYFYSGLARSKSALSLITLCCWSMAVVSFQVTLFF